MSVVRKMQKISVLAVMTLLGISNVHAIEFGFKPYIGLDISHSHIDVDKKNYTISDTTDEFGIRETETITNLKDINLGTISARLGADITDFFGIEGRFGTGLNNDKINPQYNDVLEIPAGVIVEGDVSPIHVNVPLKAKVKNYYAGFFKLQTPQYYGFRVHGLAGVSHTNIQLKSIVDELRETKGYNSFAYGIGTSYAITEKISLSTEYLKLDKDIDTINAGFTYHF